MKFAQILEGRIHYIFDPVALYGLDTLAEVQALFTPDMVFVDVTGRDVQEGMAYDVALDLTGEMLPPKPSEAEKLEQFMERQEQTNLDNSEIMLDIILQNEDIKLNQELKGAENNA